ncbi:MAG TPA: carbon starvation protein A [Candidatus Marinimicrobia bacterium]|nr:carbon starvation protein A [Candidatus Neomarinimicrobiota bacterium]MDP7216856.1 carbon starvation protein A [Candidatus Neomarinimicrobiota bacterium]HJL73837.1 carbon starvation protein A [Candidatus Neomarinimicrobiota bacterium]HJM69873.1 carbon starvation protein A [Candidatus Neomarinimicrobiota bacterium]
MNSVLLALFGFLVFFLGFRFYSTWLSKRIYGLDVDIKTPAHEFRDDVDFLPTKKHILFGHHFTSIAGAAPIIGPCVAAYWGWLPAILWVVLGTVFMGTVHDFGALVMSVKEKGKSIADISAGIINGRVRVLFLIFVVLLVWLVLAVFAMAIADLFVAIPTSVLPINIEIVLAVGVGWMIYKKGVDALLPSLLALGILYYFVWVGTETPISFETIGLTKSQATNTWVVLLFLYSGIASLLPVWLLLQPRDFINSHQLIVGLALLYLGVFVAQPVIDAPALRLTAEGPSLFPLLFVTIACGAISGFHGLVSSGTSSKQLDKLADARLVGYGGMIGEGTLALASTIAAVAGITLVTQCSLPAVGQVADLNWSVYYDSWAHASGNKAAAFVLGGGALIESLGISPALAKTLMAVLVISFAATTLDTATRIQRFILAELGSALKITILKNRVVATITAIIPAVLLVFTNVEDPATGVVKQTGWVLWPIFGASNQMLAALTLMVLTLYFWQRKKPILPLLIPMIFILLITISSLFIKAGQFLESNLFLFGLDILLIVLIGWMIIEGLLTVLQKTRKG